MELWTSQKYVSFLDLFSLLKISSKSWNFLQRNPCYIKSVRGECTEGSLIGGYCDSGEELIVLLDFLFLDLRLEVCSTSSSEVVLFDKLRRNLFPVKLEVLLYWNYE